MTDRNNHPQRGAQGEFKRLKVNSAATIAELQEFIAQARGRRPQEVLGMIAHSGLGQGIGLATVAMAAILLLGTAAPYLWARMKPDKQVAPDSSPAPATSPAPEPPVPPAEAPATPPAAAAAAPDGVDPAAAAARLGIDEAKESDPDVNPLENRVDDLFKELDNR